MNKLNSKIDSCKKKNALNNKIKKIKKYLNRDVKINLKKEKYTLFELIILLLIVGMIFLLLGYFIKDSKKVEINEPKEEVSEEIKSFIDQYNYILNNYYGDLDKEQLIKNAIKGMLSGLDIHSDLVDEESNSFTITLNGSYRGVGIGVNNDENGDIIINIVYDNTPAAKAGLIPGDIVIKINDKDFRGKKSSELVDEISKLNNIKLTVVRNGEELTFNLSKEYIELNSVSYEMQDNNIGYINVSIFASNTYIQFKKALEELEKQGMEKLIIDLRNNTGGHLSSVERMLWLFLDSSHIIYQTEKDNKIEKFYSNGSIDKDYPIVILQNSLSASASEIMASTLREEANAYIIGDTSYGKGTVQELKDMGELGQYKFTTKRWLTPNGTWIDGVGVVPDLKVSLTIDYLENPSFETDAQYKAAINYLNNLK